MSASNAQGRKPRVEFFPTGRAKEVKQGVTIISAANRAEVPIGQSCNGDGICGWCKVKVLRGMENLSPPGQVEQHLMAACAFAPDERAACLAKIAGDITVTTGYW
ncbi:MAG TPA: 2Fe-2S iron-sulfur cluster-binding protein [Bacteroidota bacterium]|nr:2Fe-2S iron-sulfur cluster-binding protein [Bacteroidota bacterium]